MSTRLDYIDGLRGLAICAVLLVHVGQAVSGLPRGLQAITDYGGYGVELFFILSALTLASIYRARDFAPHAFFIRRFFRLAPLFYLGLAFYVLYNGIGPRPDAPDGIGPQQILLTLTFFHGWTWDSINSTVPGGWSIANEAMFYALFPLLLRWLKNGKRSAILWVAALLLSRASFILIPVVFAGATTPHLLDIFAAFCFPTQLPAFIGGFVVYFVIQWMNAHPVHFLWHKTTARMACMIITAIILCCAASGNPTLSNYLLADALLMAFVIATYLAQPRIIINAVLRHIGLVSYSMYLIHFAVLDGAKWALLPVISNQPATLQLLLLYAATLALTAALATLTWRFIEQPMIALGHRLSNRYAPSAAR